MLQIPKAALKTESRSKRRSARNQVRFPLHVPQVLTLTAPNLCTIVFDRYKRIPPVIDKAECPIRLPYETPKQIPLIAIAQQKILALVYPLAYVVALVVRPLTHFLRQKSPSSYQWS